MTYGYSDSFNITGLVEVQQKLAAFGDKVVNVVTQKALMDGAKIIQKEAIQNVQTKCKNDKPHLLKISGVHELLQPGNLAKNIKIRRVKKVEKGYKAAQVFVKLKRAWYAKFVEGTESGTSRQVPQPFMRPAYESKKDEAVAAFKDAINAAISGGGL